MMILTTISERIDSYTGRVFWRVGSKRNGIIDVKLEFANDDSDLLSELAAIKYLLFETQVFGRAPGKGHGFKLIVSKGAIRKLALGKSSKKHAEKFAAFLNHRMSGVQIEVSQSRDLMADPKTTSPVELHAIKREYANTHDSVETPAMGRVYVTAHAVNQYNKRLRDGPPKNPWSSLVKRLKHPELGILHLPPSVLAHKAKKYGTSDNIEAWGHRSSKFTYLVINEANRRTVVTVFEEQQSA